MTLSPIYAAKIIHDLRLKAAFNYQTLVTANVPFVAYHLQTIKHIFLTVPANNHQNTQ
jgi:hypothetical protein